MSTIAVATPIDARRPQRIGQTLRWEGTINMSASYATTGDTLNPTLFGMSAISGGIIANKGDTAFEVVPQADGTAKVLARVMSTGVEVGNGTSIATIIPFAMIIGR